jgi:Family of unknown function (DUF6174)
MFCTSMRLSRRSGILACVCCWAVLGAPGCSRSVLTTQQHADLAAAEGRWKQNAPRDYAFVYHPISFPALGRSSARIEVRGGVVKSVTQLDQHDAGRTTIEELFASIRHASESGRYARIEATYDATLGYPTRIAFTARKGIADGNSLIEIQAFETLTDP